MGKSLNPTISLVIDPELLGRIDAYWHKHKFISRARTIKYLLHQILDQRPQPKPTEEDLKKEW